MLFTLTSSGNERHEERKMNSLVHRLDDWGRPGWIAAMVLGFIFFWPIGLLTLGFLIWSGRMGCSSYAYAGGYGRRARWERKMEQMNVKMEGMRGWFGQSSETRPQHFAPTGNHAFDNYRETTITQLEREADEFRTFLDRLRQAKDKAEFDAFMAERKKGESNPNDA
jgi:hypothetical protein